MPRGLRAAEGTTLWCSCLRPASPCCGPDSSRGRFTPDSRERSAALRSASSAVNPGTTSTGWRYVRRTCREPKICCPAEVVACRGPDELAGHRVRLVNRAGPVVKHRLNQVLECQWEPSSIARQHGEAGGAPTSGALPGNPDSRQLSISAWEKRKLALHSNDRADRETRFGPTRRRGGDARTGGQGDSESRVILLRLVIDPAPGSRARREEMFGPVLPVILYDSFDEAIAARSSSSHPKTRPTSSLPAVLTRRQSPRWRSSNPTERWSAGP